jgi:hypothetical protein
MKQLFERVLASKPGRAGGLCVLRFPNSAETRWFDHVPTPGTRIRSDHGDAYWGHLWVVDDVVQSGRNTYTVSCVERREYVHNFRHGSDSKPDLSAELLELARRASGTVIENWRRRKYRHYIP